MYLLADPSLVLGQRARIRICVRHFYENFFEILVALLSALLAKLITDYRPISPVTDLPIPHPSGSYMCSSAPPEEDDTQFPQLLLPSHNDTISSL